MGLGRKGALKQALSEERVPRGMPGDFAERPIIEGGAFETAIVE